jgi:membrane-associated phospholipid phosphatase
MQFVTDFADQAVSLPLALCAGAWLALSGWRRGAALWGAALIATLASVLLLKLAVMGCVHGASLTSPSGHTASAVFVYGGIAGMLARLRPAPTIAVGALLAIVFGATRVMLHVHSLADVIVGGAVGLAALGVFAWLALPLPAGPRPLRLLLACLPILLVLHGVHLNVEPRLRGAGHWLGFLLCPVDRNAA